MLDTSILTKQAGPLPMWGWLAVGGGGYLAWRHFSGTANNSSAATGSNASPGADTGPTDASGVGIPSTGTSGAAGLEQVPNPGSIGDWASNALNALISAGVNPTQASNAVNAYINGQPLNLTMQGLIDRVLQMLGSPPGGPISIIPAPIPNSGEGNRNAAGNASRFLAPGPVRGVRQVGTGTHTHTEVTWDPVPGATSYMYSVDGRTHSTTSHTVILSGIPKGNSVLLHVSARNSKGSGPSSTLAMRVE